jgi:hypothetical protein
MRRFFYYLKLKIYVTNESLIKPSGMPPLHRMLWVYAQNENFVISPYCSGPCFLFFPCFFVLCIHNRKYNCLWSDNQRRVVRGSMHMIYSPERKENNNQNEDATITYIKIQLDQLAAHSFRTNPPPSCPIWLFLLVLLHVVPAFAGHW